jgi:hypothetical protein
MEQAICRLVGITAISDLLASQMSWAFFCLGGNRFMDMLLQQDENHFWENLLQLVKGNFGSNMHDLLISAAWTYH